MRYSLAPATLVRMAREHSALSQRAMAEAARTAQSVVARVEAGDTDPSSTTLRRLLAAAGYELLCELAPLPAIDSHMLDDVARILRMSPEDRLIEVRNVARFEAAAKRV